MKGADFIVKTLSRSGCTDLFCIPGGVILPVLYAAQETNPQICCHLNYHEQASGFAACGYAHVSGRLGCAVVTRGPGATNIVTAVAEAWQESLPVVFITGHNATNSSNSRFNHAQEIDLTTALSSFTKRSIRIDTAEQLLSNFPNCCFIAQQGRKGPVFIDISGSVLRNEIDDSVAPEALMDLSCEADRPSSDFASNFDEAVRKLNKAKTPVILIGDGLRYCYYRDSELSELLTGLGVPIISSRGSADIASSKNYFGFVGSHGCRAAHCILNRADVILSLGNRLDFPENSQSFRSVYKSDLIQVDIDERELMKHKDWKGLRISHDVGDFIRLLNKKLSEYRGTQWTNWLSKCREVYALLEETDCGSLVTDLSEIMKVSALSGCGAFSFDAGNNEFFCSRAYALAKSNCEGVRVLCSKSFGTLGISLSRAIGACIATKKRVVCFTGDQGFQLNIQELEGIVSENLPITIVLINNYASGMIADTEHNRKYPQFLVDPDSGYSVPNFKKILSAYGIPSVNLAKDLKNISGPCFLEISSNNQKDLLWKIPRGARIDRMYPPLDLSLEDKLKECMNLI